MQHRQSSKAKRANFNELLRLRLACVGACARRLLRKREQRMAINRMSDRRDITNGRGGTSSYICSDYRYWCAMVMLILL